jgi:serine/threonine protein kinase
MKPTFGHPPIGTVIDRNSLELVEVLGTGGYGVVYRAVEVRSRKPRSYALKCLPGVHDSDTRRHLHMREVALHQLASAHPSIIRLHRVVRENGFTFLVMDFAPDGDLFGQILQEGSYLGRDALIKRIFLQIIDAVQHCHSLGIYHRDLKPENVLCFDRGLRVALTDFGLATTDERSREFKTGSVYHMSPGKIACAFEEVIAYKSILECQAGDTSSNKDYSPLHNDIWSLGIMLLNLTTGRNPWKSATIADPTFRAYRRNARDFLPTVLPISEELNDVLIQVLAIDWKKRISLSKFRRAVKSIRTFYSDQVVFEDNLAILFEESELYAGDEGGKPLPATPEDGIRSGSQITTIDGLVDEAFTWEGRPTEFESRLATIPYISPIHSTYRSSSRTSSSDLASPITPVGDYNGASHMCNFVDWETYKVDQRLGEESNNVFPRSIFEEDEDDSSFTSSVFYTPSFSSTDDTTISTAALTHGDNYKTVNRYSSPNTSIYSIAESVDFLEGEELDLFDDEEAVPESQPEKGADPIAIPGAKSRTHIFDPRRFFPRSAGKSWLNRKVRLHN